MQASTVQAEIRQLESYRQQATWWRIGAFVLLVVIVGGSLASLNSAVHGLTDKGPAQDQFVSHFSEGMRTQVMPNIQTLASQTLTEIQPQIRDEFTKLNARVPEITDATVKELQTLQTELPQASEKTLDDSFRNLLTSREAKIRSMYPDVTEEQVKGLVDNLQKSGEEEIKNANNELFAPHQAALSGIMDHMNTIRDSEASSTAGQNPDWEMGLSIFEVLRDDLKELKPADTKAAGTKDAKGGEVKK